jgi:putative FmdB family regulatory protein
MIFLKHVPTYEYECRRCPRVFEVRQRISEPALTKCDRCGGPVHRLLAATPFILKGGGWYVTDYPSEARKKALSSESGDKSAAGSETKSESKSEKAKSKSSTTSESSSSSGAGGASEKASGPASGGSKESTKPASNS